jgi:hypothetical protein
MGVRWKCEDCGARWYASGAPSGACLDCGSESIAIDTGIPLADKLRKRSDAMGDTPDSELFLEAAEAIEEIATTLPILRTMCRVAGLTLGEQRADEIIKGLEQS